MAFLNALGAVSRHGQWRLSRIVRLPLADGRLDLSDGGLVDFRGADEVELTVTPRFPASRLCWGRVDEASCGPVLRASMREGSLAVADFGAIQALFPDGWGRCVPAGVYDVRIRLTRADETALIFDEPVEIR